jgi:hypothetical protein
VSSKETELIGFVLSLKTFAGLNVDNNDSERASGSGVASSCWVCITRRRHGWVLPVTSWSSGLQLRYHHHKKKTLTAIKILNQALQPKLLPLSIIHPNGSHWCMYTQIGKKSI